MIYVTVLNLTMGPLFAALILPLSDDLQRALTISSVLFVFYLLAMVRLHQTQQYAFLQTLYWVLLLYVDTDFPILGVFLLPNLSAGGLKTDSKDDEPSCFPNMPSFLPLHVLMKKRGIEISVVYDIGRATGACEIGFFSMFLLVF
jgi:hypothetical protein